MKKKKNKCTGVFLISLLEAQSPGGVNGVSIWYKTNSLQTPALIYRDYSGNQHQIQALTSTNKPDYSLLNYNECLYFDGSDDYLKFPFVIETADKINFYTAYQNKIANTETALFTTDNTDEKELFYGTKNIFRYNMTRSIISVQVPLIHWLHSVYTLNSGYLHLRLQK